MQLNSIACEISVIDFIATEGAYYFIMADGRRADIIKCSAFQPTITDHNHYYSYLWVNSLQGYFVLRQRFVGGQPEAWEVTKEITPPESAGSDWFDEAYEVLKKDYEPT